VGFTTKKIHAPFEGAFVRQNLKRADVAAGVGAYVACKCTIEKEGGFRKGD
jgi:hypothetical protein